MKPPPKELGPWIKSIREALGWPPMKMCSFLSVSTRTLWTWETKGRPPPYAVVLQYQGIELLLEAEKKGQLDLAPYGGLPWCLEWWGLVGITAYLLDRPQRKRPQLHKEEQ